MPNATQQLRIGEFSRRVGVPAELLRAWERRYGLFEPARTEGGFRLYSEADVQRALAMQANVGRGLSASEAASLALEEEAAGAATGAFADVVQQLDDRLEHFDEVGAQTVLDRLLSTVSLEAVLSEVLIPYFRLLGERWEAGDSSIAQEHFASNVIRGRLMSLARGWGRGSGRRALLACAPGDEHDLPLLMFGLALRSYGWRISYLGANTPPESLLSVVGELSPDAVVVSSSIRDALNGRADGFRAIAELVPLWLAGGGLGPSGAAELGATYLAGDPVEAAATLSAGR